MKSPVKSELLWFHVDDALPAEHKPVLVAGGIAFRECDYWCTFMEVGRPRITWHVKWWAFLPEVPV